MWLSCLSPITVMSKARRWASTRTRLLCRLCDPVSDDRHLAFLTFVGIHALLAEPRNGIELPSCSRLCPQASALLQQLTHFEGGENLVASLPRPLAAHALWEKGVNSAGGSMRSLRILMPVGMALDILEHADMSVFVDAAGAVECRLDQLQAPDHPVSLPRPFGC